MLPVDEPELTPELVRSRHDALLARLRVVAQRAGRDPDSFRVVAVTKGFGAEVVRTAVAAGLGMFGENRVQEASDKVAAAPEAEWHMVGRLQSNKVRPALGLFGYLHSVESVPLLERVDRIAHDDGRQPRVLLQVEMTGQPGRAGFPVERFEPLVDDPSGPLASSLRALGSTVVVGLMTIAPPDLAAAEPCFAQLRVLRDRLQEASGVGLPELSMGMTADADEAVRQGATLLRIGTGLFGPRPDHH